MQNSKVFNRTNSLGQTKQEGSGLKKRSRFVVVFIQALAFLLLLFTECSAQRIEKDSLTVYVFLSETCPICKNQTYSLRELYKKYHPLSVGFVAVFPNLINSTAETIEKFGRKYQLKFPLVRDEEQASTKKFGRQLLLRFS